MIGDCFKKKNTSVVGVPQPPKHPSNDTTPVVVPDNVIIVENEFEKYAYLLTSKFEGSGIDQVTDNFDGQGISLGGLQWCIGQGSLQAKILKPYFAHYEPQNETEKVLKQMAGVSIKEGMSLCKKHFLSGTKLIPQVRLDLKNFIVRAEKYQLLAAEEIFDRCWKMCRESKMTSLKAFCFFFDVCVQNGSLNGISKPAYDVDVYKAFITSEGGANKSIWSALPLDEETVILSLWIAKRAKHNKWRADVLSRKCTIAHGVGVVHGNLHKFPEFKQSV